MAETVGAANLRSAASHPSAGRPNDRIQAAEAAAREIDLAVREFLADALRRATEILKEQRTDLDKGVDLLLTRETLAADDFPAIRPQPRDERVPPLGAERIAAPSSAE